MLLCKSGREGSMKGGPLAGFVFNSKRHDRHAVSDKSAFIRHAERSGQQHARGRAGELKSSMISRLGAQGSEGRAAAAARAPRRQESPYQTRSI